MHDLLFAAALAGATAKAASGDPLASLNDEFTAPTLANYQQIRDAESWPNEQLEQLDIGATRPGWLTMVPRTVTWYEDYRGPLLFREVTGNFSATTSVAATNRAGTGAPGRQFSLAGIMVRAPRAITPATWTAGQEKYSFLSIGSANTPGTFQFEVKSTSNSDDFPEYSRLEISASDCSCGEALIQTTRIGNYIIQIAKTPTGPWRVMNRYRRPDLPATLQVGFVAYTDWPNVQPYPPNVHNVTTITHVNGQPGVPTQPDLIAQFDYIRFRTPEVPAALVGVDLVNSSLVSDAQLLAFLGENVASAPAAVDMWMAY